MKEGASCDPQRQIKGSLKGWLNFRIRAKNIYDILGANVVLENKNVHRELLGSIQGTKKKKKS